MKMFISCSAVTHSSN